MFGERLHRLTIYTLFEVTSLFFPTLIGVSLIVFIILRIVPGDPAYIMLALTLMAAMGPSLTAVIIAITTVRIPGTVRTVRSVALSVKSSQYSEAARAIGASDWRIMLYHITPNCMAPVIVVGSAVLGGAIVTEASLSFLGLGVPPNIPTWGNMLGQSQERYIAAGPWTSVFPGLALTITAFGINLLGDALRDILDPRLRGSR